MLRRERGRRIKAEWRRGREEELGKHQKRQLRASVEQTEAAATAVS